MGGVFIDRESPALQSASRIADAIRGVAPGVRVEFDPGARRTKITTARAGLRACEVAVFLDGALWSGAGGSTSPLDFLSARDVEAIEIYRGPAETPAEFGGSASGCGVVAIWTRRAS